MVEKAGLNEAFVAIPHIREDTNRDVLRLCIDTPHRSFRAALHEAFPLPAAGG